MADFYLDDDDWKQINAKILGELNEYLTRVMDCTKYIPYLRSKLVLDVDDYEEIMGEKTRRKRTAEFLKIFEKKDKEHSKKLNFLIEAVGRDYTMTGMRDKIMDCFTKTRDKYLDENNKEERPDEDRGNRTVNPRDDDTGPIPPAPPPSSRNSAAANPSTDSLPPPPNKHNVQPKSHSDAQPPHPSAQRNPCGDDPVVHEVSADLRSNFFAESTDSSTATTTTGPLPSTAPQRTEDETLVSATHNPITIPEVEAGNHSSDPDPTSSSRTMPVEDNDSVRERGSQRNAAANSPQMQPRGVAPVGDTKPGLGFDDQVREERRAKATEFQSPKSSKSSDVLEPSTSRSQESLSSRSSSLLPFDSRISEPKPVGKSKTIDRETKV